MSKQFPNCCVYGLVDPRDGLYHYIGSTICLGNRLMQHVTFDCWSDHTIEYCRWRMELEIEGRQPQLVILCAARPDTVRRHERTYIRCALEAGHPLVNQQSRPTATHGEKERLLLEYKQLRANLGLDKIEKAVRRRNR